MITPLDVVDWSQWSVIFLKPDCLQRDLQDEILTWIAEHVEILSPTKVTVSRQQIFQHYADLFPRQQEIGVDVAAELTRIYVGRDAMVALGHGTNAPARLRALIGPTDPAIAAYDTIRGRYGLDTLADGQAERRLIDNLIHTSDDPVATRRDFLIWYGPSCLDLITAIPHLIGDRDAHP
jgi:nucleoside-diphosphate kinase